ncbi:MAG: MBOAT family protein [Lachnospiraceae bacterium]|nr:MBOAT family protein [Lachnospiraceae bacterium]
MVTFTSLNFILRFIVAFIFIYYLFPKKYQNMVLFIGSLVFYGMGQWMFLPLLLGLTILNFGFGTWLSNGNKLGYAISYKKPRFIVVLAVDVITLVAMKGLALGLESFLFPVGLSFYIFKMLSFQVDCYTGKIDGDLKFTGVAAYFTMFPQVTQGPIMRYDHALFSEGRKFSLINLELGMEYFCIGFGMKILLADRLALLWNEIQKIGVESISAPLAWMGVYGYSLELYFDFWGYSLMAAGLGVMLGFPFVENFSNPYGSTSISEFYRRWHVTLGTWFRDYMYFPLGGSRKGKLKTIQNLMMVWIVTGLWHGGTINFIIWGLVLGMIIVCEKFLWKNFMEKHSFFGRILVLFVIPLTWLIFAVSDLGQLKEYFIKLISIHSGAPMADLSKYLPMYGIFFVIGGFLLIPTVANGILKQREGKIQGLRVILLFIIFVVSLYFSGISSGNPFLYYSF